MAEAGVLGHVAVAAEDGAEVDQVVADEGAATFLDKDVERIAGLGVGVVEPGAEDGKAAEFAAALVGDGVVRVVAAHLLVAEWPEWLALEGGAGEQADGAVGSARHVAEDVGNVTPVHGALFVIEARDARVLAHLQLIGVNVDDVVLRRVVAQRVEEAGADDVGRGGHFGIGARVGLDEVERAFAVDHAEAGRDAVNLAADHLEGGHRRIAVTGAAAQLVERHAAGGVAVGVPLAVGHFAESIDAERRQGRTGIGLERLADEIVERLGLARLHIDRDGLRDGTQRIIRVEPIRGH